MKSTCLILYVFLGSMLIALHSSALVTSNGMGGGAWSAGPSWDVGVPICGDSILIRAGDVITLASQQDYSGCGSTMVLTIDGTLSFPGNGPKLKLPTGSTIIVNIGGLITASGGGNDNKISIGSEWVWEQKDGDVNGYACFGACVPLPVEFLAVEAIAKEQSICIRWITLSESNNDYFTVERSNDGTSFTQIVKVDGAGNSNQILHYLVKDYDPLHGISYYRVKQTDFDGGFNYSELVSIEVHSFVSFDISLFPNPLLNSDNLVVSVRGLQADKEVVIEIRNIQGEMEQTQSLTTGLDGQETIRLATANRFHPGLYFLSILTDGERETKKLLIK